MSDADLGLVPRADVLALAARLSAQCTVEHLQVPQAGLWLVELVESVHGDHFHLGEVPAGQACVALHHAQHGTARGGAVLLQADREIAVAAAICDAVQRAGWPGAEEVAALQQVGSARRAAAERARLSILDRTRVAFSELGQEGG